MPRPSLGTGLSVTTLAELEVLLGVMLMGNKLLKVVGVLVLLLGLFAGITEGAEEKAGQKIAVLYFVNNTSAEYDGFVRGLSDMLMTSLGQSKKLTVVERAQVDKAFENFKFELTGVIDEKKAVSVGQWLGATAIVLGSFTEFGGVYRIDARLIDVKTGKLLEAQSVKGKKDEVVNLVDKLGEKILQKLQKEEGTLVIRFRLTYSPMTERTLYHHICKLYINNKYGGTSPAVKEENKWVTLFSEQLKPGDHEVRIVHGYVNEEDDRWTGEFSKQPKVFHITIKANSTTVIKYSFNTGWFFDSYHY